jgi:hypothetical protein
MTWSVLADAVLVVHLAFTLCVVLGGFAALRWPKLAWIHVPVVVWGAAIEFFSWTCPLTPLENWLREAGGEAAYSGDFIAHYLLPLIYPPGLTRGLQVAIGVFVVLINAVVYLLLWRRWRRASR